MVPTQGPLHIKCRFAFKINVYVNHFPVAIKPTQVYVARHSVLSKDRQT